ncbi:hypothetical protein LX81_01371 [Palleronia aestuarii]|uniref:Uncharacterized protein n=1 Tax=Palleronia aestuarii TaxID=568105 RepID=A0A2W7NWG4_9RHOB|nr:hypothetical protein [Palleronia aestuarii]PZX17646.1 hypothetical protein LX81_01371 [Palleronia aestuarii]
MSRSVLLVACALGVTALGLGISLGSRYAALDEGTVIAAYAERYARETGGRAGDCVGRPGTGRVWLTIRCTGPEPRAYAISRWGNEIDSGALAPGEI